ncbi:MAG: hypothetical protein EOL87_14475 [Spartobacteria bacterium]|nr:hypothetical protein [Spartobacteria bacterium]
MQTQDEKRQHAEAHQFVAWAFSLSCLLLPASMYTYFSTYSRLALIPLILSTSGILAEGIWLFIYCQMKAGNIYKFPYGTQKMENALAVFDASFILLGVLYGLYNVVSSILSEHTVPDMQTTSYLFLFGLIGGSVIFFKVAKARKHHSSPAIEVFYPIYRFAVLRDLTTLILIAAVNLIGRENEAYLFWSDIVICSTLLILLGSRALRVVLSNFTALIELPLPEADQLVILQALAPDLDKIDMVGNIRTMTRGTTRTIEIEATFPQDTTNGELLDIQQRVKERLDKSLKDNSFHFILCDHILPIAIAGAAGRIEESTFH